MDKLSALLRGLLALCAAALLLGAPPALAQAPAAPAAAPATGGSDAAPGPGAGPAQELIAREALRQKQQPGNNQPIWTEVRSGAPQYASVPGRETNVLIQPEGQTWRARRNGLWSVVSGWALVGALLVIAIAYLKYGTTHTDEPDTGRKVLRFTTWQRGVHWSAAISFSILAISGLIMLFGKNLLLPVIGATLFSWLAQIGKNLHNVVGPLFLVSCLLLFVTFVRDNFPGKGDLKWVAALGGMLGDHPPSGKFNAAEKVWFWGGVLALGIVIGVTGLVLDFPNFDQTRATMQLAHIVHLISTTLLMLGAMGHIYLGTIGTAGAYEGMRTGLVDETWAKTHHRYWYDDIKAGKINAEPPAEPAVPARAASGQAD